MISGTANEPNTSMLAIYHTNKGAEKKPKPIGNMPLNTTKPSLANFYLASLNNNTCTLQLSENAKNITMASWNQIATFRQGGLASETGTTEVFSKLGGVCFGFSLQTIIGFVRKQYLIQGLTIPMLHSAFLHAIQHQQETFRIDRTPPYNFETQSLYEGRKVIIQSDFLKNYFPGIKGVGEAVIQINGNLEVFIDKIIAMPKGDGAIFIFALRLGVSKKAENHAIGFYRDNNDDLLYIEANQGMFLLNKSATGTESEKLKEIFSTTGNIYANYEFGDNVIRKDEAVLIYYRFSKLADDTINSDL